jgi:hypothetical protein
MGGFTYNGEVEFENLERKKIFVVNIVNFYI